MWNSINRISGLRFIAILVLMLSISADSDAQDRRAAFMLGVNSLDSSLSLYTLNAQGDLRQQRFYPAAKNPKAVAIHPAGKFAYVVSKTANVVVAYEISKNNGRIELQNPMVTEIPVASPFALTIHPSGRFLYIAARAGKIAAYAIDTRNGSLTPVRHSPFGAQNRTRSLLVHPSGRFLYAVNAYANSLSAYRIERTSGELTPVKGSPFTVADPSLPQRSLWPLADVPEGAGGIPYFIALDPPGHFMYVTLWGAGKIAGFAVDSESGVLTPLPGSPFVTALNPYVVSVHPSGDYLYVGSWESDSLLAYRIDKRNGAPAPLPKNNFLINGKSPVSLVFSAGGDKAYVANSESAGISVFEVNRQSGELSLLETAQTRPGPWWLTTPVAMRGPSFAKRFYTVDKQQKKLYAWAIQDKRPARLLASLSMPAIDDWTVQQDQGVVYVTDALRKEIHGFHLDAASHRFTEIHGSPWSLPGSPLGMQIDLNGWYLYLLSANPATFLSYGIDPNNGGLIPMQQSVPLQKTMPQGLVLDPAARFAYMYSAKTIRWFSYRRNIGPLLFERSRFGSPFSVPYTPSSTAFDPGANFLLVSHRHSTGLSVYEVHPLTGAPTEITGSPFHLNHSISKMMVPAGGGSLFVLDRQTAKLYAYRRNAVSGEIGAEYPLPEDLADGKISAVFFRGDFLYVADASAKCVKIFEFDALTNSFSKVAQTDLQTRVDGIMADTRIERDY